MRLQSMMEFSILFIVLIAFACLSVDCYGADRSFSIIYSANMKAVIAPCG